MTVLGTGIDIIEINRISRVIHKTPMFMQRVFTSNEIEYFISKSNNPSHIAGNFAAKEAVLKALGTGLRDMEWVDIEIVRDKLGKPSVKLYKNAEIIAFNKGIENIHISISHGRDYAVAQAVAEGNKIGPYMLGELRHDICSIFPKRRRDTHKGDYGRAYIIAGSRGMMGAAAMCCLSALRCGAGIVELGVPLSIQYGIAPLVMEAIVNGLDDEDGKVAYSSLHRISEGLQRASALAIGPGLSKSEGLFNLLGKVIEEAKIPIVIDADGLNLLAQNTDLLYNAKSPVILTPHPGEMARLLGKDTGFVQKNRVDCAKNFSMKYKVITVLKGAGTIVSSPKGDIFVNDTGNPGMAKGGSGDILTGIIVSILSQGIKPFDAAKAGVYIHGLAGDMAAMDKGEYGMKAGDIVEYIPYAVKKLSGLTVE